MTVPRAGLLFAGLVILCTSGCGDSHEAVAVDMLNTQKEYCAILDEVKDDASAQAAVLRVKSLADKMTALKHRSDRLGAAPLEVKTSLRNRYEPEVRETLDSVRHKLSQLDPQHQQQLEEAWTGVLSSTEN